MINIKHINVLLFIIFLNHSLKSDGQVLNPGANMSAFNRYVDVPISYYTGVPNISIPLYVIEDGDLNVPITLSYHSSGIKVNEEASWVGLGWSLNCGGVISRVIKGFDDLKELDLPRGYYQSGSEGLTMCSNAVVPKDDVSGFKNYTTYKSTTATEQLDSGDDELDIFYYSFLGRSGKFVIVDNKVELLNDDNLKISYASVENSYGGLFSIVDEDGIKYEFFSCETTQVGKEYPSGLPKTIPTGWYLSKITSPTGFEIDFEYSRNNVCVAKADVEECIINDKKITQSTIDYYDLCYLRRIKFSYGTLEFITSDRNDYDIYRNAKKLDQININSGYNKTYSFHYSYFVAGGNNSNIPTYQSHRLKLKSITEQVVNDMKGQKYEFAYHGDEYEQSVTIPEVCTTNLPRKNSKMCDHWGFYNGKQINDIRNTFIPDIPQLNIDGKYPLIDNPNYSFQGANREPDANYLEACMLKSLKYPTGALIHFKFEANDFFNTHPIVSRSKSDLMNVMTPVMGGGLRIQSIRFESEDENYTRDFEYTTDQGSSSGILHGGIIYHTIINKKIRNTDGSISTKPYLIRFANGYNGLSANGVIVGYSQVTEKVNGTNRGKTVYRFFNRSDDQFPFINLSKEFATNLFPNQMNGCNDLDIIPEIPYIFLGAQHDFKTEPVSSAGLLKEKIVYSYSNTGYQEVARKTFQYKIDRIKTFLNKKIIPINGTINTKENQTLPPSISSPNGDPDLLEPDPLLIDILLYYHIFEYPLHAYRVQLNASHSIVDGVSTSQHFVYDSQYHFIKERNSINSHGNTIKEKFYYPFDYSNTVNCCSKLIDKNIIKPVKTEQFKQNQQIGGEIIEFTEWGLPQTIYRFQGRTASSSPDHNSELLIPTDSSYFACESYKYEPIRRRMIEKKVYNQPVETYLWEAPYQYPHTKIVNANYEQVQQVISPIKLSEFETTNDELRDKQVPKDLRKELPNALVTNYNIKFGLGPEKIINYNGLTERYLYNGWGQQTAILNDDGNIIKSNSYHLKNNVDMAPPQPSWIKGKDHFLSRGINVYDYSVEPTPAADGYNWQVPVGAKIVSGLNTNEIKVRFGNVLSGDIKVTATNAIGESRPSILTVNTCPDISAPTAFTAIEEGIESISLPIMFLPLKGFEMGINGWRLDKGGKTLKISCGDQNITDQKVNWIIPKQFKIKFEISGAHLFDLILLPSNDKAFIEIPSDIPNGVYICYVYIGYEANVSPYCKQLMKAFFIWIGSDQVVTPYIVDPLEQFSAI